MRRPNLSYTSCIVYNLALCQDSGLRDNLAKCNQRFLWTTSKQQYMHCSKCKQLLRPPPTASK